MDETKIAEIVRLHLHLKRLILYGEETEPSCRSFLPPVMELRSAFDHLMRAYAAELGVKEDLSQNNANYVRDSLNKCVGHVYRAFFDVADYVSLIVRKTIIDTLSPYSHECINAVMPEYYKTIRPSVDQLSRDIARIRERKDVADSGLLSQVEEYLAKIKELDAHMTTVLERVGSFQECEARREREDVRSRRFSWIVGVVCAMVGALVAGAIALYLK